MSVPTDVASLTDEKGAHPGGRPLHDVVHLLLGSAYSPPSRTPSGPAA